MLQALILCAVTATPYPVKVTDLPPPLFVEWPIFWVAVGALVPNIALAIVTGLLFRATRNMAGETKKLADKTAAMAEKTGEMADKTAELARDTVMAADRADIHHQQSLWPFTVPHIRNISTYGNQQAQIVFGIENIGPGLALYTQAFLEKLNGQANGCKTTVGPIAPRTALPGEARIDLKGTTHKTSMVLELNTTTMFGTVYISHWSWKPSDLDWVFEDFTPPSIKTADNPLRFVRRVDITK